MSRMTWALGALCLVAFARPAQCQTTKPQMRSDAPVMWVNLFNAMAHLKQVEAETEQQGAARPMNAVLCRRPCFEESDSSMLPAQQLVHREMAVNACRLALSIPVGSSSRPMPTANADNVPRPGLCEVVWQRDGVHVHSARIDAVAARVFENADKPGTICLEGGVRIWSRQDGTTALVTAARAVVDLATGAIEVLPANVEQAFQPASRGGE
jgi:hypothetical protein